MALTTLQYEKIKRVYEERRLQSAYELDMRKAEIYVKIPEYKEINDEIISTCMRYGKTMITNPDSKTDSSNSNSSTSASLAQMHSDLYDLRMKKNKILTDAGYPHDYLEMTYVCSECRDTGYIGNEKCRCFKQMEVEFLYDSSQLHEMLAQNNFSLLSRHYYQGEELEQFENILTTCKNFINNFNSDYRNLYFYGTVGTGKSFLSGCIAKELLDRGSSIVYFSAVQIFQTISAFFYEKDKTYLNKLLDTMYNCDLLIIDDLGTELTNDFVRTQLFSILTERGLRRKSIIISTNLSLEELRSNYSERVFSRICGNFELLKFKGKDIRMQKKLELTDN